MVHHPGSRRRVPDPLHAVACLGLLAVARTQSVRWPRFLTVELHRSLALLSVVFLAIHIVTAIARPLHEARARGGARAPRLLVSPAAVALGVISVYLVLAVIVTSLLREQIGHRLWRASTGRPMPPGHSPFSHSLTAGSDAFTPPGCLRSPALSILSLVSAALLWRLTAGGTNRSRLAAVTGGTADPIAVDPAGGTTDAASPLRRAARRGRRRSPSPTTSPASARCRPAAPRPAVIPVLESSGLLGRGGAGFPVGRKWRSVASQDGGAPVILVNGAEGEPLSSKDRTLIRLRPHLVLDGALLAADAVGADRIALYIGYGRPEGSRRPPARDPGATATSTSRSACSTRRTRTSRARKVRRVHFVNEADARPTVTPPRPYERGVGGRPTLVQNVESLAHAALIARFGDGWYRELGRATTPGTALVTVSGSGRDGVREIEIGTTIGELAALAACRRPIRATARPCCSAATSAAGSRRNAAGTSHSTRSRCARGQCLRLPGSSPSSVTIACGVRATARIMDYMAGQSAAQCGPCVFGLRAISDATARIATGTARARRPCPHRALVAADRRPRRLPPSRWRRRPAPQLDPRLRAGVGAAPAPSAVQPRAPRAFRPGPGDLCRRAGGLT